MRIRSLGYVRIESADPQKWLDFGTKVVGMMQVDAPGTIVNDTVYLKMDDRPYRFAIYKGEREYFGLCGWELFDEAGFEEAKKDLEAAGVSYEQGTEGDLEERSVRDLVRFQDPGGNTHELYWGGKLDFDRFISPLGIPGFVTGQFGSMGLGHAVLPCENYDEGREFFMNVMGFGNSDSMSMKMGDFDFGIQFMHVDNPRHHSLAIAPMDMTGTGCIHVMVEVEDFDEVGRFMDRVKENDVPVFMALGRHCNDDMLSIYVTTPSGFALEFGCGGLQIEDWDNFTPTSVSVPSIWGHQFGG